jgi:hypothetical protein
MFLLVHPLFKYHFRYLFIYLEQTQNKKQNRILLSDWAQDPHQDGTPRTLQLLSEPKIISGLLIFKVFSYFEHLLNIVNQILVIINIPPFPQL